MKEDWDHSRRSGEDICEEEIQDIADTDVNLWEDRNEQFNFPPMTPEKRRRKSNCLVSTFKQMLLTIIFLNALRDGFNFSLLTVGSSELKASHLKGHQSITKLNDVDQTVEVVRCQYKAVPLCYWTPASYGHKNKVPTNKI